jgi:hypothetical protein
MSEDDISNRGLASADEQTRERVARAGGKASVGGGSGGNQGVSEGGERGFASMPEEKRKEAARADNNKDSRRGH